MSSVISVRFRQATVGRLRERAESRGVALSALVERLVDEGLRMEDHPGIVFRPGATGRRAGLARGPDVWEVIGLLRRLEPRGDGAIAEAASWLDLPKRDVRSAIEYYAAFPEEIDQQIAENERGAERARSASEAQRRLLS